MRVGGLFTFNFTRMNKKVILSALAFMLAIGGAFASKLLTAELAYSKKTAASFHIPQQLQECVVREECLPEGTVECFNSTPIIEGGVTYPVGSVKLFKLDNPDPQNLICNTVLYRQ